MSEQQKIFPLLVESLDHMKLTPSKKEFAKAVMRAAIEYACARQAGFVFKSEATEHSRQRGKDAT